MRIAVGLSLIVIALVLMGAEPIAARSQDKQPTAPPSKEKKPEGEKQKEADPNADWPHSPEMVEHDILYRAAVELHQSERRTALAAAEQILTLARRLKESATGGKTVNASNTLESIQKNAKRIRSLCGGGESDQLIERMPADLESGIAQIIALAEDLKQQLERLDHRVISVGIIGNSNTIVQLAIHLLRQTRSVGS
jgi:hypothetical protein